MTTNDITVNNAPSPELIAECESWPVWESEARKFDWYYTETEMVLIIEGEVTIKNLDGTGAVTLKKGDYAELPCGLECQWDIQKPFKKHYNFK
ncbi:MAG: cupin domain-containing protein [Phycisphaerae bacterium]|jgi:uncharacterized cupin superfamily protein